MKCNLFFNNIRCFSAIRQLSCPSSTSLVFRSYASKIRSPKKQRLAHQEQEQEQNPAGDVAVSQTRGHGKKKNAKGTDERIGNTQLPNEAFNLSTLEENMKRSIERLRMSLNGVVGRVGRLSSAMLDPLRVDIQGEKARILEYASVSISGGSELLVTVYDQAHLAAVERALHSSKVTLNPQKLGATTIKCTINKPDLKVREALAREASTLCENARTSIRAARHQGQKEIKQDVSKSVISQDESVKENKKLEDLTKKQTVIVDGILSDAKKILLDE